MELCELQSLLHEERILVLVVALEALLRWWRGGGHAPRSSPRMPAPAQALAAAREWLERPDAANARRALAAARDSEAAGFSDPSSAWLCRAAADAAYACGPPGQAYHLLRGQPRPAIPRGGDERLLREEWLQRSVDAYVALSQAFRALADLELDSRLLPRHPGGRGACVRDRTQELLETAAPGVCVLHVMSDDKRFVVTYEPGREDLHGRRSSSSLGASFQAFPLLLAPGYVCAVRPGSTTTGLTAGLSGVSSSGASTRASRWCASNWLLAAAEECAACPCQDHQAAAKGSWEENPRDSSASAATLTWSDLSLQPRSRAASSSS